jgi:hypothetical protein
MPTVAIVDGVKIQLFAQEHPPRHFHAVIAEHRAQIDIASLRVLSGSLPRGKLAAVISWARPRQAELHRVWDRAMAKQRPGKIE